MKSTKKYVNCPACDSRAIEPVPFAYAKGVRIGQYVTLSAVSHALAPPQQKGEVFVPSVVGTLAATVACLAFPSITDAVAPSYWGRLTLLDQPCVVFGLVVGMCFAFLSLGCRIRWNCMEYRDLLRDWENTFFCRRCGHAFPDPQLNNGQQESEVNQEWRRKHPSLQ